MASPVPELAQDVTEALTEILDELKVDPPVRHRVVAAGEAPALRTSGCRSVFELALALPNRGSRLRLEAIPRGMRCTDERTFSSTTRAEGLTRCTGGQYPSDRWTPEREAKERARRARQRPPKPTKRAKTKSDKLRQLIKAMGADWDD